MSDKQTQKDRLLKMFADNGNQLTLGMIMKTKLACEYRKLISLLRTEDNYDIPAPVLDRNEPSNNLYTLYGKIDLKPPHSPVETPKENTHYSSIDYDELKRRYAALDKKGKIAVLRKLQLQYTELPGQYEAIEQQIERLLK